MFSGTATADRAGEGGMMSNNDNTPKMSYEELCKSLDPKANPYHTDTKAMDPIWFLIAA